MSLDYYKELKEDEELLIHNEESPKLESSETPKTVPNNQKLERKTSSDIMIEPLSLPTININAKSNEVKISNISVPDDIKNNVMNNMPPEVLEVLESELDFGYLERSSELLETIGFNKDGEYAGPYKTNVKLSQRKRSCGDSCWLHVIVVLLKFLNIFTCFKLHIQEVPMAGTNVDIMSNKKLYNLWLSFARRILVYDILAVKFGKFLLGYKTYMVESENINTNQVKWMRGVEELFQGVCQGHNMVYGRLFRMNTKVIGLRSNLVMDLLLSFIYRHYSTIEIRIFHGPMRLALSIMVGLFLILKWQVLLYASLVVNSADTYLSIYLHHRAKQLDFRKWFRLLITNGSFYMALITQLAIYEELEVNTAQPILMGVFISFIIMNFLLWVNDMCIVHYKSRLYSIIDLEESLIKRRAYHRIFDQFVLTLFSVYSYIGDLNHNYIIGSVVIIMSIVGFLVYFANSLLVKQYIDSLIWAICSTDGCFSEGPFMLKYEIQREKLIKDNMI